MEMEPRQGTACCKTVENCCTTKQSCVLWRMSKRSANIEIKQSSTWPLQHDRSRGDCQAPTEAVRGCQKTLLLHLFFIPPMRPLTPGRELTDRPYQHLRPLQVRPSYSSLFLPCGRARPGRGKRCEAFTIKTCLPTSLAGKELAVQKYPQLRDGFGVSDQTHLIDLSVSISLMLYNIHTHKDTHMQRGYSCNRAGLPADAVMTMAHICARAGWEEPASCAHVNLCFEQQP